MSVATELLQDVTPAVEYLRRRIHDEFPLARHIGIEVEHVADDRLVLCAPFAPNANHNGTAFGGSQFCIAVLTGWAWATCYLAARQVAADAVIQESSIRYVAPARGPLRAILQPPPAEGVERLRRMLRRAAGRGRIRLNVDVHDGAKLVTQFHGVFAVSILQEGSCPVS
jgi:thioesterase domain-containing protein